MDRSSFGLLVVLIGACTATERSEPEPASPEVVERESEHPTPEVIDAEWVASKFQAPPPPEERDWAREIARHEATYNPETPLRGWPPVVGQLYPSFVLRDQSGQAVAISDFKGKVVLIELVGLTCKACHAFSGGNEPGMQRFRGIQPQPDLTSIERYAEGYAKVSLDRPDIVFVQLVLYGMDGRSPPLREDVRDWAQHFQLDLSRGEYVLIGDQRFISPQSRKLIPGFHLVDQHGILRAVSSNDPQHDPLHSSLLPKLATLVGAGR